MASPNGTLVPPAASITDDGGMVWTISAGQIHRDGAWIGFGEGVTILWQAGNVYVESTAGGDWYVWTTGPFFDFYGPDPPPSGGDYFVSPGTSIQSVIDGAAIDTEIVLLAGFHREQTLTPKNGMTIRGEGVLTSILSGGRVLSTWTLDGSRWYASGQTQEGGGGGVCMSGFANCFHPEDVFIDNVMLIHAETLAAGAPGKFFFDYAADRIYIWDNPAGKTVETSVTTYAFLGTATGVTIENLIIEKYASPAQNGTIKGGSGWIIQDNEIRFNHGIGCGMGGTRQVLRNYVHHNGQLGIGGSGSGSVVDDNEIAYNNTAHYSSGWEAGGTKFTFSNVLTLSNNFVHHNFGPGLWTDIDNINVIFEDNICNDNWLSGIFHEISYACIIRRNICKRNGTLPPLDYWIDGAGICISSSRDTEVYENDLEDNWQGIAVVNAIRGTGAFGLWEVTNLHVHDNIVRTVNAVAGRGRTGFESGDRPAGYLAPANNRFVDNTYYMPSTSALIFFWESVNLNAAQWQAEGQDVTGTFVVGPEIPGTSHALKLFMLLAAGILVLIRWW